jgi:hypothetical protein
MNEVAISRAELLPSGAPLTLLCSRQTVDGRIQPF